MDEEELKIPKREVSYEEGKVTTKHTIENKLSEREGGYGRRGIKERTWRQRFKQQKPELLIPHPDLCSL